MLVEADKFIPVVNNFCPLMYPNYSLKKNYLRALYYIQMYNNNDDNI